MLLALTIVAGCVHPSTPSGAAARRPATAIVVPDSHGTVAGWLADYADERNYVTNNLVMHLDRLGADPRYTFTLTEVPTMIALAEVHPGRLDEVRRYLAEGRLDLGNAFYENAALDIFGGEAQVRLGIEGIRWQEAVFGVRPRVALLTDAVAPSQQVPQIAARLGLRGIVYTRNNPAGVMTHRWRSPDGSSMLTAGVRVYTHWSRLFEFAIPATEGLLRSLEDELDAQRRHDVPDAPTLLLAGRGDYSGPPLLPEQVGLVLEQWAQRRPDDDVRFGTLAEYFDALEQAAPALDLPEIDGAPPPSYGAFWSNVPRVKQALRRTEHLLQASELLAAFRSLEGGTTYPSVALHEAWVNLFLNMDRNVSWGAARGEVFESPTAWDVNDRFDAATGTATNVLRETLDALTAGGQAADETLTLFNPLNWERTDPVIVETTGGRGLEGIPCEALPADHADDRRRLVCRPRLPSAGYRVFGLTGAAPAPIPIPLPQIIETPFYAASINRRTGGIVSVRTKTGNVEVLSGKANLIVGERDRQPVAPGDFLSPRGQRQPIGAADDTPTTVTATRGPVATTIRVEGPFLGGGRVVRTTRFYADHPRIDFETEMAGIPDGTLVLADFRMAGRTAMERYGIPYGFGAAEPGVGPRPAPFFLADDHRRLGFTDAIRPVIRWSAYDLQGGGAVALLDRGIPGREVWGNNAALHLMNAHEAYRGYPNPWASGGPAQRFSYALLVGDGGWQALDVPRRAWELNAPPWAQQGHASAGESRSWLTTSPNVIVESVRRDGSDLEIRFVDWTGRGGDADVQVDIPHEAAARTDLLGERAQPLPVASQYRLPLAPQEIVTLRLRTASAAPPAPPIMDYRPLAPPVKRASFDLRHDRTGHPE